MASAKLARPRLFWALSAAITLGGCPITSLETGKGSFFQKTEAHQYIEFGLALEKSCQVISASELTKYGVLDTSVHHNPIRAAVGTCISPMFTPESDAPSLALTAIRCNSTMVYGKYSTECKYLTKGCHSPQCNYRYLPTNVCLKFGYIEAFGMPVHQFWKIKCLQNRPQGWPSEAPTVAPALPKVRPAAMPSVAPSKVQHPAATSATTISEIQMDMHVDIASNDDGRTDMFRMLTLLTSVFIVAIVMICAFCWLWVKCAKREEDDDWEFHGQGHSYSLQSFNS